MHPKQRNNYGQTGYINDQGKWQAANEKPILPKSLYRYTVIVSHRLTHVSTGGMVSIMERTFTAYGFSNYSKKNVCLLPGVHDTTQEDN